jgi:uncharacterized protein (DUF4415 family)
MGASGQRSLGRDPFLFPVTCVETTQRRLAEIGKFYRPPKKPVTIHLDTDIINWLKSYGRGYQTKTNMLLRHSMKSSVRAKANKRQSA